MKFLANITGGILSIYDIKKYENFLKKLKGNVCVEIQKIDPVRSLDHNRYYWKCLHFLADNTESGYTAKEFHEAFKYKFLPKKGDLGVPLSTTTLSPQEFGRYVEEIKRFSAEFYNLVILEESQL